MRAKHLLQYIKWTVPEVGAGSGCMISSSGPSIAPERARFFL
jgi:hypothetical protein